MCFNGFKEVDRRTGNIEQILHLLQQLVAQEHVFLKKLKEETTTTKNKKKKKESAAFVDVYISRSGYVATNFVHPDFSTSLALVK